MNFYVVRHGQTDFNKLGVYQGRKDVKLNEVGIEQAKIMAENLNDILGTKKVDAIIVSPLTRAKQTAEPLVSLYGIKPIICDDLIERGFGNLEGERPRPELSNKMMLDYNMNISAEGIEPIQTLFKRVYKAMDRIIKKYKRQEEEKR